MQPHTNERTDPRHDAASATHTRAHHAPERALAAREAAEQATTAFARRTHHRVGDLYGQFARSHEDFAPTLYLAAAPRRHDHAID